MVAQLYLRDLSEEAQEYYKKEIQSNPKLAKLREALRNGDDILVGKLFDKPRLA